MAKTTRTVLTDDFRLKDMRGREFQPSSKAITALMMSNENDGDWLLRELQPGIEKDAVTAFEVPSDVVGTEMTLIVPEKEIGSDRQVEVKVVPQ